MRKGGEIVGGEFAPGDVQIADVNAGAPAEYDPGGIY